MKLKILFQIRYIVRILIRIFSYKKNNSLIYRVEKLAITDKSCFFGYHDLDPSFDNGHKILSHVYSGKAVDKNAIKNDIDVGYFEKKNNQWVFNKIGSTRAWCWQQGARLQTIKNTDKKNLVFYNTRLDKNKFGSCAIDIDNNNKVYKSWDEPFNVISSSGKFGGVLNFGLLGEKRPGYGYYVENVDYKAFVKVVNLNTNELIYYKCYGSDVDYINHLHFSPNDRWLIYFKFLVSNNSARERTLCIVDLENKKKIHELTRLNFSHFAWLNNDELILSVSNMFYWKSMKFNILNKKLINLSRWIDDFHPYKVTNSEKIIFDSYPYKGQRFLYISNKNFKGIKEIDNFFDNNNMKGECRVDLHPKYCNSLDAIHVDFGNKFDERSSCLLYLKN
jgi:hypothetical protein